MTSQAIDRDAVLSELDDIICQIGTERAAIQATIADEIRKIRESANALEQIMATRPGDPIGEHLARISTASDRITASKRRDGMLHYRAHSVERAIQLIPKA